MDWNKELEVEIAGQWYPAKIIRNDPKTTNEAYAYVVQSQGYWFIFDDDGKYILCMSGRFVWYNDEYSYQIRNKQETVITYEWTNPYWENKVWSITEPTAINIQFKIQEHENKRTSAFCGSEWIKTGRSKEIEI
jgi:hypothetical protein